MQTCPLTDAPPSERSLAEGGTGYSLRATLMKEVRENPLRSGLNAVQTASIVIGVVSYLVSFAAPPKSYVQIPPVLLQADPAGKLTGHVQIVAEGEVPIRLVSGHLVGVSDTGQLLGERPIKLSGPTSMMSGYGLTLTFDKAPEHIVFCLNATNERGAVTEQRLVLGLAPSAQSRQYLKTVALYQRVPDGEAPAKPGCKV